MIIENSEAFKRLAVCNTCPELIRENWTCAACGCFLKIKARKDNETCPLNKWPEYVTPPWAE